MTQEEIIRSTFKRNGHDYESEITIFQGYAIYEAMEEYADKMGEFAFNMARDRMFNPDGSFREYRFVNYQHYLAYVSQMKQLELKTASNDTKRKSE